VTTPSSSDLTGRCARCGGPATRAWTSRDAMRPLELDETHYEEHQDAIKKGGWKPV
jgi:hypothetical protein